MEAGIEEKVRKFHKTRSITLACEIVDKLFAIYEEDEEPFMTDEEFEEYAQTQIDASDDVEVGDGYIEYQNVDAVFFKNGVIKINSNTDGCLITQFGIKNY